LKHARQVARPAGLIFSQLLGKVDIAAADRPLLEAAGRPTCAKYRSGSMFNVRVWTSATGCARECSELTLEHPVPSGADRIVSRYVKDMSPPYHTK